MAHRGTDDVIGSGKGIATLVPTSVLVPMCVSPCSIILLASDSFTAMQVFWVISETTRNVRINSHGVYAGKHWSRQ